MNGAISAPPAADPLARKRRLQEDLSLLRLQKAEVLRRIQSLAKKARSGATSAGGSLSGAAPPPETRRAGLAEEQRRRAEALWSAAGKVVSGLLANQNTRRYFGAPVDVNYAPSYYEFIKRPMDLGTVRSKLDRRAYGGPSELRDDVRLVFDNCREFNPAGNHVRALGDAASDKFEKRWAQLGVEAAWATEARRAALERERLEAELKSLPDKVREAAEELQELAARADASAAERAEPGPPGPHRGMSFEEKRRLSAALAALPGERLGRVLAIVQERRGEEALPEAEGEEMELDVDALDPETLWALQKYADGVAAEIAAKQPPGGGAGGTAAAAVPAAAAAAGPAEAEAEAEAGAAAAQAPGVKTASGQGDSAFASEGDEVGSRGVGGAGVPAEPSTFVSATGEAPGGILRAQGGKKDVQLQNAGAWAALGAEGATTGQEVGAEAGAEGTAPAEEDEDELWSEFEGRAEREERRDEGGNDEDEMQPEGMDEDVQEV